MVPLLSNDIRPQCDHQPCSMPPTEIVVFVFSDDAGNEAESFRLLCAGHAGALELHTQEE